MDFNTLKIFSNELNIIFSYFSRIQFVKALFYKLKKIYIISEIFKTKKSNEIYESVILNLYYTKLKN